MLLIRPHLDRNTFFIEIHKHKLQIHCLLKWISSRVVVISG